MNESIKKIQEAMLVLHKEIAAVVENQERIDEILDGMSGTLSKLKEGKVPKEKAPVVRKPAKKKSRRKSRAKVPQVPSPDVAPSKVASSGNGAHAGNGSKPVPRSELSAAEKERIIALDAENYTGVKIAKTIGRSQAAVARFLRMRKMNEEART